MSLRQGVAKTLIVKVLIVISALSNLLDTVPFSFLAFN